jgi:hypothetical protein
MPHTPPLLSKLMGKKEERRKKKEKKNKGVQYE